MLHSQLNHIVSMPQNSKTNITLLFSNPRNSCQIIMSLTGGITYLFQSHSRCIYFSSVQKFSMPKFSPIVGMHRGLLENTTFKHQHFYFTALHHAVGGLTFRWLRGFNILLRNPCSMNDFCG